MSIWVGYTPALKDVRWPFDPWLDIAERAARAAGVHFIQRLARPGGSGMYGAVFAKEGHKPFTATWTPQAAVSPSPEAEKALVRQLQFQASRSEPL